MTQPSFVPIIESDQVRPAYRLSTPRDWRQTRVAEVRGPVHPKGKVLGVPGPDQGYALLLAHRLFEERLVLTEGISAEDALNGCAEVASARAALFGRAPVAKDIELALLLFGLVDDAGTVPADLVAWRAPLFQSAAHHYQQQRQIVASVPEETLRLAPGEVRGRVGEWRQLLHASASAASAAVSSASAAPASPAAS